MFLASQPDIGLDSESKELVEACSKIRMNAVKLALEYLSRQSSSNLEDRQGEAIINILMVQITIIESTDDLMSIMDHVLEAFEANGQLSVYALQLVPILISSLESQRQVTSREVPPNDSSDFITGCCFRVINHAWPRPQVSLILDAVGRFPLTRTLRVATLEKGAHSAKSAELQDLPAIIHQLTLVAASFARNELLSEIMNIFYFWEEHINEKKHLKTHQRQLLEIEGSVLLYLQTAIKYDKIIAKIWLERIKSGTEPGSSFAFAFSLMIASIPEFEQEVINLICQALARQQKDSLMKRSVPWLFKHVDDCSTDSLEMYTSLLRCIRNSAYGQEILMQPIVNLGFSLMDFQGMKKMLSFKHKDSHVSLNPYLQSLYQLHHLGIEVLKKTFVAHKDSRGKILSKCADSLISCDSEISGMNHVKFILHVVHFYPDLMETHLKELRIILENLRMLPKVVAISFIASLRSMCRSRREIADIIVLVLRKLMFSKETVSKIVAAKGFILLVENELSSKTKYDAGNKGIVASMPSASCQNGPSLSQLGAFDSKRSGGVNLLQELMGFLRRCLTQQPEVRKVVYEGLPTVLKADPAMSEHIAQLLLPHLAMFFEGDELLPAPLKLEACVRLSRDGTVARLIEPIPDLLVCVRKVLASGGWKKNVVECNDRKENRISNCPENFDIGKKSDKSHEIDAGLSLSRLFYSLRQRLIECPLEDFSFDLSSNFNLGESLGELNNLMASLLLGCYEVCMEDIMYEMDLQFQILSKAGKYVSCQISEEATLTVLEDLGSDFLKIFANHRRLTNLVVEGSKGTKLRHQCKEAMQTAAASIQKLSNLNSKLSGLSSIDGLLVPIDQRHSMFSEDCMEKMVIFIVQDGFVSSSSITNVSVDSLKSHVHLSRNIDFQIFVLQSIVKYLDRFVNGIPSFQHHLEGILYHTESRGVRSGDSDFAELIFCGSMSQGLASAVFQTTKTLILANAKEYPRSREKDLLLNAAVHSLEASLSCANGSIHSLANIFSKTLPSSKLVLEKSGLNSLLINSDEDVAKIISRLPILKNTLDALLNGFCFKELESYCHFMASLAEILPSEFSAVIATWFDEVWSSSPKELASYSAAVRAVLQSRLQCHLRAGLGQDAGVIEEVSKEIGRAVENKVQDLENDVNPTLECVLTLNFEATDSVPLLSSRSLQTILLTSIDHIEASLVSMEWSLHAKKAWLSSLHKSNEQTRGQGITHAAKTIHWQDWENLIFRRMESLSRCAYYLASIRVTGSFVEHLCKMLVKIYRQLTTAAKSQIARRGEKQASPGQSFQSLAGFINSSLSPKIYQLITEIQVAANVQEDNSVKEKSINTSSDNGNDNKSKHTQKGRGKKGATIKGLQKELRIVPSLVYHMEEWEKWLVRVSKAGKLNLLIGAKRAISRDFRLKESSMANNDGLSPKRGKIAEERELVEQDPAEEKLERDDVDHQKRFKEIVMNKTEGRCESEERFRMEDNGEDVPYLNSDAEGTEITDEEVGGEVCMSI